MALGDLEQVTLFALVKLGGTGHGAAIDGRSPSMR